MPDAVRWTAVGVLLICGSAMGVASTVAHGAIVDAVNAQLPRPEQFKVFGWHLPKFLRLRREYLRLYPAGNLLRREGWLAAAMLGCMVGVAALLGFGTGLVLWFAGGNGLVVWLLFFRKGTR
jgi:hypothetical protein